MVYMVKVGPRPLVVTFWPVPITTEVMQYDGCLTREQFNNGIVMFAQKCQVINENWCVRYVQNNPEQKYLVKRRTIAATAGNKRKFDDKADDIEESLEEDSIDTDACMSKMGLSKEIRTFEYHVVYSPSYNVPVLYFSAWTQDGKLLPLDDIWKQVSKVHHDFLNYDKWSFITQQEHPLLQRPYFLVHPCHTADLMKQLLENTSPEERDFGRYLITWLSAVGPAVGIRLPLQFAVS